jgi:hypothetical protein
MCLAAEMACAAQPPVFWRFERGGRSGEAAAAVAPEAGAAEMTGRAGAFERGAPPVFDAAVPFQALWDGVDAAPVVADNHFSLRFLVPEAKGGGVPVGSEIAIAGGGAAANPASFTVEAFVRVARQTERHALIASKRRNGQTGASWSLSVTPAGTLSARFDTQPGTANGGPGFNQIVGSAAAVNDGAWHHVALTYDAGTREAGLYADYAQCGRGATAHALVYDASDLVVGRGLDGWLDEVRLSPEALHPEQFLRPARFFSDLRPAKQDAGAALLDQTFTRVQSALAPGLTRIGTLIPKTVHEMETSQWSLGCETLDRDLADWDAYKGYLEPLGIKRVRLQGGWNRTEKKKGEYDFSWLDHIVDDAQARGLEVCLETSYNNRLYEANGATGPGGLLPAGDETLAAWDRWVEAMARRYSAKGVKEWMMYNEPNLRKENRAEDIVANTIRTARLIKRVDPEAKIGAFVLAGLNVELLKTLLEQIKAQGQLGLLHWAVYHGYSGNPDRLNARMDAFNAVLAEVAPAVKPWQGEAGCASEEVQYALSGIPWTEYSHAKWNARRMLCDIGHGIESSVFTISDLTYHKDFISRYGLLKTRPDNTVCKVKTAYYTVQNVVSVFNDALERAPDCTWTVTAGETNLTGFAFRDRKSGLSVVALWDGREIPSNDSAVEHVDLTVAGGRFREPVWIDLVTGNLYEIPGAQMVAEGGAVRLKGVPVYDGPGAIADRSLLHFEKARPKKGAKPQPVKAPPKPAPAAAATAKMAVRLLPGTQQPAPAVLIVGAPVDKAETWVAWLHAQELHALVLAADATEAEISGAIQTVRGRSAEWQVKPDAVGVLAYGPAGARAALGALRAADFGVLLGAADAAGRLAEAQHGNVFVGKSEGWETALAPWLEKRKGKVF